MFISKKRQKAREQAAYELGLNKGYELGWQMRRVDRDNRGFIIAGALLDRELDEIQQRKGGQDGLYDSRPN